jgi:16S rRNA C967 or C1407 C5-methylase (RsmB/RsmF family)
VHRNARRQRQILTEAAKVTEDGGEIIYATCSLEPEENELNIDWAVANLPVKVEGISCPGEKGLTNVFGKQLDCSIEKCRRIWPEQSQGFFVCKLRKQAVQQ